MKLQLFSENIFLFVKKSLVFPAQIRRKTGVVPQTFEHFFLAPAEFPRNPNQDFDIQVARTASISLHGRQAFPTQFYDRSGLGARFDLDFIVSIEAGD